MAAIDDLPRRLWARLYYISEPVERVVGRGAVGYCTLAEGTKKNTRLFCKVGAFICKRYQATGLGTRTFLSISQAPFVSGVFVSKLCM